MKRILISLGAVVAFLGYTVFPVATLAAPNSQSVGSSGLSVEPRKNLVVQPGQTVEDKLKISNLSKSVDLYANISIVDFTYSDQSGSPKFFLAKDAPQTPWSLKPYISLPEKVEVPPGQTRTVKYSVTIPEKLGAGAYYSAILYSTGSPNSGNVNLSATNTTLMFTSVPGTVHEKMTLKEFGAFQSDNNGNTGKYAFINLTRPQLIGYTLKNEGDVPEAPSGSITIYNMWGRQVARIEKANPTQALALIDQTRRITTCIQPKPEDVKLKDGSQHERCDDSQLAPGRYTAKLDMFYGQNGNLTKEITGSVSFWYIPWWLILLAILVVLALISMFFKIRRKVRAIKERNHKTHRRR